MIRKLMLYGGAFNPPHLGHERLVETAMASVQPDRMLIVPSEVSPHKDGGSVPFFDRAYMCRAFLKYGENVRISGIEYSGARRKSYTINTVQRIKKIYRDADIFLLIGGDMLRTFDEWRLYRRLLSMVTLIAAGRGDGTSAEELTCQKRMIERLGGRVLLLEMEPIKVSSTEVREKLKGGEDTSGYVSDFVAKYVRKRNLYR